MLRTDPRSVRPTDSGPPGGHRTRRRGGAWLFLALGTALLTAGVVLGDGLLLAAGLVLVGAAGHLLGEPPAGGRRRPHRGRR